MMGQNIHREGVDVGDSKFKDGSMLGQE
jgi:hypothetical protein